jgi:hypothetical protein
MGAELMPSVARPIVQRLFDRQATWKRKLLVREVIRLHESEGGVPGTQDPFRVVKMVLYKMQTDGLVRKAHYGTWELVDSITSGPGDLPPQGNRDIDFGDDDDDDADDDETDISPVADDSGVVSVVSAIPTRASALVPDHIIGAGSTSVYVYFSPNDKKLAVLEGRDYWECKVGRTSSPDVDARIFDQGVRTAISRQPVVGLVIHTDNCVEMERALHAALRHGGAGLSAGGGGEWFLTSPDRIERWHSDFMKSTSELTRGITGS